jgi:hypothetical protein
VSRTGPDSGFAGIYAAMQNMGSPKHIGLSTHVLMGFYQHTKKLMRVFYLPYTLNYQIQ